MPWFRFRRKRQRRSSVTKHYTLHKENARSIILARLEYWNQFYNYDYNRVAIRNQKTCWGSCTSKKNLNFSYKLIFLPPHLLDYIVVHELCHLEELNHGKNFWGLVAKALPEYKTHIREMREIETWGTSVAYLEQVQKKYQEQQVKEICSTHVPRDIQLKVK